jgi:Bacterial Ig domain
LPSRPRLVLIGCIACLLMLGFAAGSASAANRYADPAGTGTACTDVAPCTLATALTGATNGDHVILLPSASTYDVPAGTSLTVPAGVAVHGQADKPRPTIVGNSSPPLDTSFAGITLEHLRIQNTTTVLFLRDGLIVRDVIAVATGATVACVWSGTGTMTDSVCWAGDANAIGAGSNLSGGFIAATLRNVTAVGGFRGMSFGVNNSSAPSTVDAKNVIAYAINQSEPDIQATASSSATTSMTVTMGHSNYSSRLAIGTTGGTASVTDPTTNNNQTALPQFVDLAGGDFHQGALSPTVNAGTADAANGPTDFDGEARSLDTGPDIGADELGVNPVAVDDSPTIDEDVPTDLAVLANDTDDDGGVKQVLSNTAAANGTATIVGGGSDVRYHPNPNYCGVDSFDYTMNGGDTATVSVTVSCVDDAPAASGDARGLSEDASSTALGVLANDTDVDGGPKAAQSTTAPAHGTAQITGGDVAYQPAANYCGPDSFTYTLNGGSTATVSITVGCVEDAPVAVGDAATVAEGAGQAPIDVLANDTDVDGGTKSIASASAPAHGSAVVTGGGTAVGYRPAANYCGSDSFTYALNGGSSATVSIAVTCVAPNTSLRKKPPKVTRKRKAKFRLGSTEVGSTFLCKLDRKRYRPCRSPATFTVRPGKHRLRVKAVDLAGNADPTPVSYRWKVLPPQ